MREENGTDRQVAEQAKGRAAQAQAELARLEARRFDLVQAATEDYRLAGEAARVVEAGPGPFGLRNRRMEATQARRMHVGGRGQSTGQIVGYCTNFSDVIG